MNRLNQKIGLSQTLKISFWAFLAGLTLLLILYPGQVGYYLISTVKPVSPAGLTLTLPNLNPAIFADTGYLFKNTDLASRKNLVTDLYDKNLFRKPESIQEAPKPQYAVVAKRMTIVTAYSSTPDQTDNSPDITAMGTRVHDGIVAANFLKFGTKVRLPEVYGDKVFVVEDRMATFNHQKLDVWMGTRDQAIEFGAKKLTVEIVEILN